MPDPYLLIGEITKPQGIRGEMKLKPFTADVTRFDGLTLVYKKQGDAFEPMAIEVVRVEADAVYLCLDGITDRTGAEKMRGMQLFIDRAHALELDEDENFICDLIGVRAVDDFGREIGVLADVLQPGACDVYVFRGGMGEVLVPALKRAVLSVDIHNKTMLLSGKALDEVAVFED